MGLLSKLRREKTQPENDAALEQLSNTQVYTRNQNSAQEAEDRQNKGIDIDMIDPAEVVTELKYLAHYEYQVLEKVPVTDDKGEIVYELAPFLDSAGKIVYQDEPVDAGNGIILLAKRALMTKQPKMAWQLVTKTGTRVWAIAVLGYLNKVWPTIWMSPDEADTTWFAVRTAFHSIQKSMTYAEKQKYGIILRMARDLCLARCEDMKEGHKALLLKVKREELGVHMSKGPVGGK
jgi:hypothetical protein